MSFSLEDREKEYEESLVHARRGGCIAVVLLIIIIPPLCYVIANFTQSGQALWAHTKLAYTYYGLPLTAATYGMPDMATYACTLDKTKPANYQEEQEQLSERYASYHAIYSQSYQALAKLRWDTSMYEAPSDFPSNLAGAKITFCLQRQQ